MAEAATKIQNGPPPPSPEEEVVFAEERRLPLSDEARDAVLRALEEDREPTEAAMKAAAEYRQAVLDGRFRTK
jgi:hypothetical protein